MPSALGTISELGNIPEYKPQHIQQLMNSLNMEEKGFAFLMNVTPLTVRLWVTGAAAPCNPAKRLMQFIETVPTAIELLAERSGSDEE